MAQQLILRPKEPDSIPAPRYSLVVQDRSNHAPVGRRESGVVAYVEVADAGLYSHLRTSLESYLHEDQYRITELQGDLGR